jgi:hypothetical protein
MAMRSLLSVIVAFLVSSSVLFMTQGGVALAAFHCMRIDAVKAGWGGNANVQYVELRMDNAGHLFVAGHTLEFFDGSGTLKATFTFPANVTNASLGESILIATSEFNAAAQGGAADFAFSNANTVAANGGDPLHPVQPTNGRVVYGPGTSACFGAGPLLVDSVAYGTATADFGTAASALAGANDTHALRLGNLNTMPVNNSTEYSPQMVSSTSFSVAMGNLATDFTTPRNNGRMVLALPAPPPSVGGIAEAPAVVPAAAIATGSGGHAMWYAVAAGMAAVTAAGAAAAWTWRRRRAEE